MNYIKIKHKILNEHHEFDVEIKKLVYILSKLENNNNLKYENQKQIENLMKKYGLFDEYFLKNINMI